MSITPLLALEQSTLQHKLEPNHQPSHDQNQSQHQSQLPQTPPKEETTANTQNQPLAAIVSSPLTSTPQHYQSSWIDQYASWFIALNPLLTGLHIRHLALCYRHWITNPDIRVDEIGNIDDKSLAYFQWMNSLVAGASVKHALQANCNMYDLQQSKYDKSKTGSDNDDEINSVTANTSIGSDVKSVSDGLVLWPFRFGSLVPVNAFLVWVLLNNPMIPFLPKFSTSSRQVFYEGANRLYNLCYDYNNRSERDSSSNVKQLDDSTTSSNMKSMGNAAYYLFTGGLMALPTLAVSYYATRSIRRAVPLNLPGWYGAACVIVSRCLPPVLATSLGHLIDISTANRHILLKGTVVYHSESTTENDTNQRRIYNDLMQCRDPVTNEPIRSRTAAAQVVGWATTQKALTGSAMLVLGVGMQQIFARYRRPHTHTLSTGRYSPLLRRLPIRHFAVNAAQITVCGLAVWMVVPGTMASVGEQWMQVSQNPPRYAYRPL